jgi:hypothetical protein
MCGETRNPSLAEEFAALMPGGDCFLGGKQDLARIGQVLIADG